MTDRPIAPQSMTPNEIVCHRFNFKYRLLFDSLPSWTAVLRHPYYLESPVLLLRRECIFRISSKEILARRASEWIHMREIGRC